MHLADGGLETTLVFHDGIDLPDFASFPLLDDPDGTALLDAYFSPYLDLAERMGTSFVLDTCTWRANPDWGSRRGYDAQELAAVNRRAVDHARAQAATHPAVATVVNGVVGPRGDGYVVGEAMTADRAADYHSLQASAFAAAGADVVTAVTMTYADEAVGVVRAASAVDLPVVVSFTLETDGRLPSGQHLGEAVREVDEATGAAPEHYMVNCAHPTHFLDVLRAQEPWVARIQGIRANSSTMSHAELDVAEELDRGDVAGLAAHYAELDRLLPDLRIVGGCCGTDLEHVTAIAEVLATA